MFRLLSDILTSILNIYIITQSIMWPFFEAKGSIISYSLKGKSMGELSGQFTVFRNIIYILQKAHMSDSTL